MKRKITPARQSAFRAATAVRRAAKRSSLAAQPSVDELDSPRNLKRTLLQIASEGVLWHERAECALSAVGLRVSFINRLEHHHVWEMRLKRGTFHLAADNNVAARQIRDVLIRSGMEVGSDELRVLEQRQGRIHCVFMAKCGVPRLLLCD
jgi:hypothetical protein